MVKNDGYIDKIIRVALLAAIAAWSFQLIYPLLGILSWGFILAVVLYPFYYWLNNLFGKRSILAATLITLFLLLLVLGITLFITNDIAHTLRDLTAQVHSGDQLLPKPPETIKQWPLIGDQLYQAWWSASDNFTTEVNKHSNILLNALKFMLGKFVSTGKDFILFVISIIFSGFLLVYSASLTVVIRKFAKRVAHHSGIDIINIIKDTIQNISRGVIGISLLQTFIFWALLLVAGVQGAALLSILALILSIAQIGLVILVIPIIIWLFLVKSLMLAVVLSTGLILDALLDGFLKPFVLSRGLSTPMMIIFIGVIGGIWVYGLIGVFIGPVVLAVSYALLHQWIEEETSYVKGEF